MARLVPTMLCLALFAPVGGAWSAEPADAVEGDELITEPAAKGWSAEAGAAAIAAPVRSGSRWYRVAPMPLAEVSYGEVFEASTRDGLSYAALATERLKVGPLFDLDQRERPALRRDGAFVGVFGTGGVGAFAEYALAGETKARLEVTEGVLARRGVKAELSVFETLALTPNLSIEYGALARGGDRLYAASTYGLPRGGHRAQGARTVTSGGLTTLGPTAEVSYTLTGRDTLSGALEVDRLVGAAASAPAARSPGTRNAAFLELAWRHKLYEER